MTDTHQRYNDNPNTNDPVTFVSVKSRLRDFGEKKAVASSNDDDDTFVSVRERLRKFDTRQDDDDYDNDDDDDDDDTYTKLVEHNNRASMSSVRDSMGGLGPATPGRSVGALYGGSITSPLTTPASSTANLTTPRNKFSHLRSPNSKSTLANSTAANVTVTDPKSYPPVVVSFLSEADRSSSLKENSAAVKEAQPYGNVLLKKVEKPNAWKKNVSNDSSTEAAAVQRRGDECLGRLSMSSVDSCSHQQKINTTPSSSHRRTFPTSSPSPGSYRKSLPNYDGTKAQVDHSPSVREGVVSDSSKPVFASLKLRSVGTPTNPAARNQISSRIFEKLKHFDGQGTPCSMKQTFDFDSDDKKSTLVKRRRMPTTVDLVQASAVRHGDRDIVRSNKYSPSVSVSQKRTDNTSVSDLARTFSRVRLESRGEHSEEERVTAGASSSAANEITEIKISLRSTAKELEEVRKSLNTPVAKMIAERNRAAQEYNKKKFSSPDEVLARMKAHRRSKSMSSGPLRRTKSMSSTHTGCSTDGRSNVRGQSRNGDQIRGEFGNALEGDGGFSDWEDFIASNIAEGGNIWDMNLDESAFFGGLKNSKSCTALNRFDDDLSGCNDNRLLPSNSTISENSSDTEGEYCHKNYGHSRYIQITLSSGGITEKFEPAVVLTPTEESTMSDETLMVEYPREFLSDSSPEETSDSRRERRQVMPFKGAKKFFFGKNKKKSLPVEF